MRNSSYGDANIVMAISMMWNLRVTCIYAETLFEIHFRHSLRVAKADMVFVLSSSTEHYVTAGKCFTFFVSSPKILVRDFW